MSALVLGATGLCGSFFVKFAEKAAKFTSVNTITRRELDFESKANQIVEKDSTKWSELIPDDTKYLFSGLATTRAAAGGLDNQYKIDYDLNIELAKAAKEKGCSTLVLVSSAGANEHSWIAYLKMKGEIERDMIKLGFDHTIILRPGAILGERTSHHKGFGNDFGVFVGRMFYRSKCQFLVKYPVYAEEVSKVGVHLALENSDQKVQIIESSEILEIAKNLE
ncbi:hypothetical protein Kpol_312p9 [Vanderwaltozyma polyspora DSM 70294]|uniref:Protein FMP52, mitochondrial n=1 Tax=Vanderwaltozyma polyspora (strain ATCC 22028 / DSM 70294 / BCRC 21397 / CBS 2163 / NBRC 10782 / NRRL Y-8283 / UCD 57-17) TaxID=436907 RepID=A7TSJ2_VANPO|nr:uncharacterized protein Kpol_312p9 [Vanderwaltozyma polyspora DSM 70294]EDO14770.1 hypothetical protein Kpol_312p9 [Vanderwaltozyma polyspora DSM 70294]